MIKAARYVVTTVALLLFALLVFLCGESYRITSFENLLDRYVPDRDSVTAYIDIEQNAYLSKGYVVGLQYTLMSLFAEQFDYRVGIIGHYRKQNYWDSLRDGSVDIIIIGGQDTIPSPYDRSVVDCYPLADFKWVVRKTDRDLLKDVNLWLGTFSKEKRYADLSHRFLRSYSIRPYMETGTQTSRISPYDDIVKRQSHLLGWDWKLVSAVIEKESRFSMGAYSRRGAVGLMQVMEQTAAHYDIHDLFNPESNVKAGVCHLRAIKRRYEKMGMDSTNVVKFTLAAYNAGEGRIEDCMNFTRQQGEDPMNWEVVARTIPLMKDPGYYEKAELKYGPFTGTETIRYVDDVLSQYEKYLYAVK